MCDCYAPEIDHRIINIFDILLATSLTLSSCLLQHNDNIGKDKDKNVIECPQIAYFVHS